MNLSEWLVRHVTYPAHERLHGRHTLGELATLSRLATRSPADVNRHCAARLRDMLCFAQEHLPYYRSLLARCGTDPRAADPYIELAKLPVLGKADVRAHREEMLCRKVPGGPIPHSSGGTTGDTLHFYIDRVRQAQQLAARLFMQGLFGVRPGERRAYLWGSPIEARLSRLKRWHDRCLNEILLNAFEMSPAQMDAHLATILAFKPSVLYGYPSAAALLARHAARRYGPRDFPWLRLVVLTGEEVAAEQVDQAGEVFGCRVACEYGSREVGLIAHDCPHGRMHVITPHVHVEVVGGGAAPQPLPPGHCGEIACTTLNTRAQPMIRYLIGDVGTLLPQRCSCGLPFPLLRLEGGKITGFIALRDGRLCHGAVTSHVLRDQPGIVEFKTYQRELDSFEVLLVVDERFEPAAIPHVQQRYRELFGPQVNVACRVVERIPPDPSGKRRYVVSDVAPDYARFEIGRPRPHDAQLVCVSASA
jgi:phenylacetate-CoA ligase